MNKRTLLAASLLAAAVSQASEKSEAYLEANTGSNQKSVTTLCLKVDTYSIVNMSPNGIVSHPMGLIVDRDAAAHALVIVPNSETKECETGYIKIQTTAPLMSIRNAPIGL